MSAPAQISDRGLPFEEVRARACDLLRLHMTLAVTQAYVAILITEQNT